MSAWVVSKKHVDLIVAAVAEGTRDGILKAAPDTDRDALGQMLVTECVASVSYRYPDDDVEAGELPGPVDAYYLRPYRFEHPRYLPTAAELYKAVCCYQYQSCEHTNRWEASEAMRLCQGITAAIEASSREARRMRDARNARDHNARRWDAYEEAPWGFDAEDIALCAAKADPKGAALVEAARSDAAARPALSDWMIEHDMIAAPLNERAFWG